MNYLDKTKSMLLPELVDSLGKLAAQDPEKVEKSLLKVPQQDCSVVHRFGPGTYIREVFLPAGTFAIGHYQKYEHTNVFLKGKVVMYKEDGSTQILEAPMIFTGKPGRKVGMILEDVVWLNIYATEETDIETLEKTYLDKSASFEEHLQKLNKRDVGEDREDFKKALAELGVTPEEVWRMSDNKADQIPFPFGGYKVMTSSSDIHGLGLFATGVILTGEFIAPSRINGKRTPAGRYTNHSKNPNAKMIAMPNGDMSLVAIKDISGCVGGMLGEEITVDYRQVINENKRTMICQQ